MKTKYTEIIKNSSSRKFELTSKIYSLGRQAEIIQKLAQEQIEENGEFAKIHCANIVDWMQEMVDLAEKSLDIQLNLVNR
jgi:hypothetical protein